MGKKKSKSSSGDAALLRRRAEKLAAEKPTVLLDDAFRDEIDEFHEQREDAALRGSKRRGARRAASHVPAEQSVLDVEMSTDESDDANHVGHAQYDDDSADGITYGEASDSSDEAERAKGQ